MYVVVHGETLAEPVEEGTNREAILAGADITRPPRPRSRKTMRGSRERCVLLEISARKGHCLANGHVAKMARCGASPHLRHRFPRPVRSDLRGGGEEDRDRGGRSRPDDFALMQQHAVDLVKRAVGARE